MQPFKLRVVGLDPSLRNWGIAIGELTEFSLDIHTLKTINPLLPTSKQVRQNSNDLESAMQLYEAAAMATQGADAVFIECPVGSQSARAMASYGICIGVCGALRANGIPFFEVTATEVKMAGPGKKTASKDEMIAWGLETQPNAPWPYHHGEVSKAKAEHMADAIGAIYAGLKLSAFRQMVGIQKPTRLKAA
jgi:Holliday junction resolvasome RuvABC endonuclease subunit